LNLILFEVFSSLKTDAKVNNMENTRNPYLLGFLRQHLSLLQFQVLINDIYAERFGPCQQT